MKDKPIVVAITLIGGAVTCICSIINGADLLDTLVSVLATLIIFLIMGLIVNKIINRINADVHKREMEEKKQREDEELRLEREAEEEEKQRRDASEADEYTGENDG